MIYVHQDSNSSPFTVNGGLDAISNDGNVHMKIAVRFEILCNHNNHLILVVRFEIWYEHNNHLILEVRFEVLYEHNNYLILVKIK